MTCLSGHRAFRFRAGGTTTATATTTVFGSVRFGAAVERRNSKGAGGLIQRRLAEKVAEKDRSNNISDYSRIISDRKSSSELANASIGLKRRTILRKRRVLKDRVCSKMEGAYKILTSYLVSAIFLCLVSDSSGKEKDEHFLQFIEA